MTGGERGRPSSDRVEPSVWRLSCPACGADFGPLPLVLGAGAAGAGAAASASAPTVAGGAERGCAACGAPLPLRDGILDARPDDLRDRIEVFLAEYGSVRRAEGRGSDDPGWYRDLPRVPAGHPHAGQWAVRAGSWRCLVERVLRSVPAGKGLDLGAGMGWLSARLAAAGWDMLAVDLSADARDGLGAARHFGRAGAGPPFERLLAHFDRLPLAAAQADLVVFNASFHYSSDFAATLAEALRVMAPGGSIVVMDSPSYRKTSSGSAMVRERREDFERRFGFASDALGSREFLVEADFRRLGESLGIGWRSHRPAHGLRWRLRPLHYRLAGKRREPARFLLWHGRPGL